MTNDELTYLLNILSPMPAEIRLHAGEMTAQEMRTVLAVLGWMRSDVKLWAERVRNEQ